MSGEYQENGERYPGNRRPVGASARKSKPITSDDASDLAPIPEGIHVNISGNLVCYLADDTIDGDSTPRTFVVVAGMFYPYQVKRMMQASTAGIIAIQ
jgi:hypothetical protein